MGGYRGSIPHMESGSEPSWFFLKRILEVYLGTVEQRLEEPAEKARIIFFFF